MKLLFHPDSDNGGYTLIELLVVVVIIGILAAIAIPQFVQQAHQAAIARVKADLSNSTTGIVGCSVQDPGVTGTDVTSKGNLYEARCGVPISKPNVRQVLGHDPETNTNSADYPLDRGFTVLVCDPEYHLAGYVNTWDGNGLTMLADNSCSAEDDQIQLTNPVDEETVRGHDPAADGNPDGDDTPSISQTDGWSYYFLNDYASASFQAFGTHDGDRLVLTGDVPTGMAAANQGDQVIQLTGRGSEQGTYTLHFEVQRNGAAVSTQDFFMTVGPANGNSSGSNSQPISISSNGDGLNTDDSTVWSGRFVANPYSSNNRLVLVSTLPEGMSRSDYDGNNTYSVSGIGKAGTYPLTFEVQDQSGNTLATKTFDLVIASGGGK